MKTKKSQFALWFTAQFGKRPNPKSIWKLFKEKGDAQLAASQATARYNELLAWEENWNAAMKTRMAAEKDYKC